ncbi:MAG: MFS transporter, partial [Aggregatilineales bacterium]
ITSLFWISAGISGVFFGNLANRYDRRLIVMGSMVASAPAFFLLPIVDGAAALVLALLAGGFSGGAHSIIILLAQEMLPKSKGFASGAMLGFIFGTGAIGSLLIGAVSDVIGLGVTFQATSVAIAIAGLLALLLPKNRAT